MTKRMALESDPVANQALALLVGLARPKRVWLFGSRARGENDASSDYDFALESSELPPEDRWKLSEALGALPTLRRFDVVWLELASTLLKEEISHEGICLYER
jgi:uncharacterized protein